MILKRLTSSIKLRSIDWQQIATAALSEHSFMDPQMRRALRQLVPSRLIAALRPVRRYLDPQRRFDRRFNVDTSGFVAPSELGAEAVVSKDAAEYVATPEKVLGRMLQELPLAPEAYPRFGFVDLGSGKGAVLLYASEYPFKTITGVELSAQLHDIATRNIARYNSATMRCRDVKCLCMDARQWAVPPEPLIVFLANPFKGKVLQAVSDNIEHSLATSARPIFVIYYHPLSRQTAWDEAPFLRRLSRSPSYSVYQGPPSYA